MQKLLTVLSNLIFPPRPTEELLQNINLEIVEKLFRPNHIVSVEYLSHYKNPYIQASIIENKFHHNKFAAKLLGQILENWVSVQNKKSLYTPIPLGDKRRRDRGHNQAESILRQVTPKIDIRTNIIVRNIETLPQTQLDKAARLDNIKNAFSLGEAKIDWTIYDQVVIVDDVVTTGSTLRAAKNTLRKSIPKHIKVVTLALAH